MNRLLGYKSLFLSIVALWSLVTLLALAGMYKLWWERERVDYLSKSVTEQRKKIWQNAGMSQALLAQVDAADKVWPDEVRYAVQGDHNQLSYAKYILLPRIPDGSGPYTLRDNGEYSPTGQEASPPQEAGSYVGFFLSVLLIGAMAKVLQKFSFRVDLSTPEAFGLITLLVMACSLLSRVYLGSAVPAFQGLMLLGVVSLVFLLPAAKRKVAEILKSASSGTPSFTLPLGMRFGLILVIALFILWSLLMSVIVVPDDWDAWAIWGAKAKVLALGHGSLHDVTYFGHGDYPLLWPTIWAFSAWLSGGWEEMWSRGWGSVFLLLCVWEAAIIVRRSTASLRLGLLCGAFFVSIPMVSLVTSWSYAEAPFWFLTTACVGLIRKQDENCGARSVLAALLAAAAAYTKNEGVMFAGIVWCWLLLAPETRTPKNLLLFILTFSLCYLPWFYWTHTVLQLESHAVAGLQLDVSTVQRALSRIPAALETIVRMWLDIKQWSIVLWLCLSFVLVGSFSREGRKWIMIPAAMLVGYFLIIIFHHAEIYWQVGTAWNRLTLHALPLLLVGGVIRARELVKGG